ncbi:DUF373 family protein [Candidatus Micrarchaeota archaeon]|nr:DUF373 family protein [Candidatus Micrarchaeota archaeon]
MAEPKRLMVLNVDWDNDLGEKARVKGPVIGKKANIDAATKFAIADPTDTDGNTIFEAVKTADDLQKQGLQAEVVTITGSSRLGYYADREVVKQLEKVIERLRPEACVFVSDGASDDQVIPLIQSRVRINSVRNVVVKQTKELEKTYFVLLEKLKEPHFARIVFGIPGLLLILVFFFQELGLRIFVGLLGAYLIFKGFGFEDRLFRGASRTEFSLERASFIFYFAAASLVLVSIYLAASRFGTLQKEGVTNIARIGAYVLKDFLLLFPISLILIIGGQLVENLSEYVHNQRYRLPGFAVSAMAVVLLWMIATNAADWVIGTLSFSEFFLSLLFTIVAMYLVIYLAREFKNGFISKMNLEGKQVYTEVGGFIGKIVGVNKRQETFLVQTSTGQKIDFVFDHITHVGDKLVIRY